MLDLEVMKCSTGEEIMSYVEELRKRDTMVAIVDEAYFLFIWVYKILLYEENMENVDIEMWCRQLQQHLMYTCCNSFSDDLIFNIIVKSMGTDTEFKKIMREVAAEFNLKSAVDSNQIYNKIVQIIEQLIIYDRNTVYTDTTEIYNIVREFKN